MKKILFSVTAILTALFSVFGVLGCKPNEPEIPPEPDDKKEELTFTEKEPYFVDYVAEHNWRYANGDYDEFIEYLDKEYKINCDESFYIWTPGEAGFLWYGNEYNSEGYNYSTRFEAFEIYAIKDENTDKLKNTKVIQNIFVHSIQWANNDDKNEIKNYVALTIVSEYAEKVEGEFTVKFGQWDKAGNIYNFADIYCGKTCVATCYFDDLCKNNNEQLSLKWYGEYIKNHLVICGKGRKV